MPTSSSGRAGIADYEPAGLTIACVGCITVIFAARAVALGLARLDVALARLDVVLAGSLLQSSRVEVLAQRVSALAESRAEVVDAADAEPRRIERDLHDGAQQRLVSLAMNLGMARTTLADTDPQAKVAIEAHDEAKQALAELRDLVRGLHPAVLDDRGLDAALSGVAARSPVPVRLRVSVPTRPSRAVEAVAYFVVSEALANVAKHAQADQAEFTAAPSAVRAYSTSGDVAIKLSASADGYRIDIQSDVGDQDVSVPSSPAADRRITVETVSGDIRVS